MTDFLHKLSARTFKTGSQTYSRLGHKAILRDSNIIVFGGTNFHNEVVTQILNINCESYEVSLLNTRNTVPVENFSLNEYENIIFLWGGKRTSGGNTYVSNELWKFQNNLFSKVLQNGHIPEPRMMHSSVIYSKKYMVIYGGISDTQVFNDWYSLDLETYQWNIMTSNIQLPLNLQAKIVWLDTRGVILISQKWNLQNSKAQYCCDLYQFKIRKRPNNLHVQLQKIQVNFKQPLAFRAFPTVCKYKSDTLCLAIIGGQRLGEELDTGPQLFSDCWIVNLETYEGSKAEDVQLTSKYGHEAVFYKDRILLIGGICSTNDFSTFLETIDFKLNFISIDRKLCQACKSIYGLEDYGKPKFSIKCEYQANPRSYVSAKLVKKFAQVIQNPIKAFGLLIDNSLNMNANMIQIDLRKVNLDSNIYKDPQQHILEITDNSYGFTKDQILQSLFTFGFKVQTFTHDSKFQQQLAVRKQFGLNVKLASMRLGKSCLIMINTIEEEQKFIGFFSIDPNKCPQFKNRFNCFYYFINENNISSQINRHIIRKNVQHLIDLQNFEQSISLSQSKIFIFDFNSKSELNHVQSERNIILEDFDDEGIFFDNLKTYLKYLYLKPYVGRKIKVLKENIDCQSLIERFKKDQNEGKIQKIDLMKYSNCPDSYEIISLYEVLDKAYWNRKLVLYSENRLISSFDFSNQMVCGIVDLKPCIQIGIGKGSIETQIEQRKLRKSLLAAIEQLRPKRNHSSSKAIKQDEKKSIGTAVKKRKI